MGGLDGKADQTHLLELHVRSLAIAESTCMVHYAIQVRRLAFQTRQRGTWETLDIEVGLWFCVEFARA